MRYVLRAAANSLAFYLALYLVDSIVAPRFLIETVWIIPIIAVFLGALNSLVRPLPKLKTRPRRAVTAAVLTVLANALTLQVFIWIGAPLSATNLGWVLVAGAFVSLVGGLINWLIGFKSRQTPRQITGDLKAPREPGRNGPRHSGQASSR